MSAYIGSIMDHRVRLNDGRLLDVFGGFASGGPDLADRKLFGYLVDTGMDYATRGCYVVEDLGLIPADREPHTFVVYEVGRNQTRVGDDDIYATVIAETVKDVLEVLKADAGYPDKWFMGMVYDHPAIGFEEQGCMFHIFNADEGRTIR